MTTSIEMQRKVRQRELDGQRTQLERNQLGQFATPAELASEIVLAALSRTSQTNPLNFLEPSVGSGSFFHALLKNIGGRKIAEAVGVEIDERFATVAEELWGASGLEVLNQDFLSVKPRTATANLLIANPPYVRHHHIEADRKKTLGRQVNANLGISVSGLAGLYCYFMLLADSWLAEDAVSAWLIPSEFMDVNYGKALRTYLTEHVSLNQIHRYCPAEDKFDDALVSSAVVVFTKRKPHRDFTTLLSFGGPIDQPRIQTRIANEQLRGEPRWTRLANANPRPYDARPRIGGENQSKRLTVGDLFTVKRGIATGANGFFILPKSRATELGLPGEFLRPILPSPRYVRAAVIERDRDGYPKIEKQLSLIDCNLSEDEIMRDCSPLWEYLLQGKEAGIPAGYLTSRRDPWYSQERRSPAPFLCSYMGRSEKRPFRFFWNQSDAIAADVYLMLYPKPALATLMADSIEVAKELFEMFSRIKPEDFFDEGRVYGGGLFKLEPAELKRLPVKGLTITEDQCVQQSLW